jgi:hypothetical protein
MILQLDDNFRVTCDAAKMNFQLEKLSDIIDKNTREVVRREWGLLGSHGNSMRSVLVQYSKEALIDDDGLENINDVLKKLDEINQTIAMVVKRENIRLDVKKDD